MPQMDYESFWQNESFAVVGHKSRKNFPYLTYEGLKKLGKTVYPVDPSATQIAGDTAYAALAGLPRHVDAVVLEVPKDETKDWVAQAVDVGIKDVWIHMQRDTPEALALAEDQHLNVRTGTCAVMYLNSGSYHAVHRWVMKALGKY